MRVLIVGTAEDYLYSSARIYASLDDVINVEVIT
jgi:hypothetical protein